MALKGYIDFSGHRERAKAELIARIGKPDYVPPSGWDSFYGTDADLHRDRTCELCGRLVIEVRPFGPNYEAICEDCAAKDMTTYERMRRAVDGDA